VAAEAHHPAPATRWERLLDLDRDLAEALGEDVAARARDRIGVATVSLPPGSWEPTSLTPAVHDAFALLVCRGLIVRELGLADTVTADLLGPGDLVASGPAREPLPLLSTRERWHVTREATVAILDDRVLPALHAWPALGSRLIARAAGQAARAAEQRAISQLPRVELRIRALLWHLAERWGRMGASGVVVPLELTHTALGQLIGARRSTVTLALGELTRDGAVVRRDDGSWLLRVDSNPSTHGDGTARAPGVAAIATPELPMASARPPSA
jgi:CRP/FNR family transcriptional regulator, cyclic AMP receptor protein